MNWRTGQSDEVVIEQLDKFAPADIMGLVEQHIELSEISMKATECPNTLFSQIAMITQKYKGSASTLSNTEKVAAIIRKAPKDYQTIILSIRNQAKRTAKDNTAEPTLKQLQKGLNDLYKAFNGMEDDWKSQEVTMFTKEGGNDSRRRTNNKSKLRCYGCGKQGHLKRECEKKNNKCSNCGKKGHF